jgi:SPP1 family predicted phage head-tail adaptor
MVKIGKMRDRVSIEQEVRISDGQGGSETSWSITDTVWARVSPLRGKEKLEAMKIEAQQIYTVMIRGGVTVTPQHRLGWGDKILNIRSVSNPDEKGRFLELMCEEGVRT